MACGQGESGKLVRLRVSREGAQNLKDPNPNAPYLLATLARWRMKGPRGNSWDGNFTNTLPAKIR